MFHISYKWMEGVLVMHGLQACVSQVNHGIVLVLHSSHMFHISSQWVDVVSIMNRSIECVSQNGYHL
jgi:hypothetical protein